MLMDSYLLVAVIKCLNLYSMLIMQVKNLPLTRPNFGKDVRHFEFEFVSDVSYPVFLTLLYPYIDVQNLFNNKTNERLMMKFTCITQ